MDDRFEGIIATFENEEDREFIKEALRIQQDAEQEGITLRLLGSLAFRIQCPENSRHFEALERRITDIDFAASTKDRERLFGFFKSRGYVIDEDTLYAGAGFRYIFENPEKKKHVDVFFEHLEMCHTIVFKDRMNIDRWTISLADLLLEKMQIVKISMKDLKDTAILLLENEIGEDDRTINIEYISKIMSNDWGFYHTFTTNLRKLTDVLAQFNSLDDKERNLINQRIEKILGKAENSKKSLKWKARATIGTRMKWYREVD